MTSLVLLEYDASGIKQPSRSAVAAAQKLGEVHVLVAGASFGNDAVFLERYIRRARHIGQRRHTEQPYFAYSREKDCTYDSADGCGLHFLPIFLLVLCVVASMLEHLIHSDRARELGCGEFDFLDL